MIYKFYCIITLCIFLSCQQPAPQSPRSSIDYDSLTKELESMYDTDQAYRKELSENIQEGKPFDAILVQKMNVADSINQSRVVALLDEYGWLPKNKIGEKAFDATFLVIQHAPVEIMERYLPSFKLLAAQDSTIGVSAAMMEDRVLMYQSKKQIYGTQSSFRTLENGTSEYFIWPIEAAESVNERRENVGFGSTIEESAAAMNAVYNPDESLVVFGSTF